MNKNNDQTRVIRELHNAILLNLKTITLQICEDDIVFELPIAQLCGTFYQRDTHARDLAVGVYNSYIANKN